MNRNVYLEGELGYKYGNHRVINAPRVGDIFRCLKANFDNFTEYLIDLEKKGFDLKIKVVGKNKTIELKEAKEVDLLYGIGDIIISIVPSGSNKAIRVIVGAVAIVAGIATGQSWLVSIGVSLFTSGLMEYLAPDPSVDERGEVKKDSGYLYRGTAQEILETDPVPVLYGRMRVPGRPISYEVRNTSKVITNYTNSPYADIYD